MSSRQGDKRATRIHPHRVLITGLRCGISRSRLPSPITGPHCRSSTFPRIPGSTRSSTVDCHRRQRLSLGGLRKVSLFPALRDAFLGHRGQLLRPGTHRASSHTGPRPPHQERETIHHLPSPCTPQRRPQPPGQEHLMTSLEQETGHLSSFQEKHPSLKTSVSWFPFGTTQPSGSQMYSNP